MKVYIVHEIEGGSILEVFLDEEDARGFLNWGEATNEIKPGYYTITCKEIKRPLRCSGKEV